MRRVERWEETSRREIGVDVRTYPRVGAVFSLVYEVTECLRDKEGTPLQWRYRVVRGEDLRQASMGVIGVAALLEVVAKGAEALASIARAEDERVAKDRATSRRKRR